MEVLNQMLSETLEAEEASGEGEGVSATETCVLGSCAVTLPVALLEDPEVFFSVLTEDTWKEVLTDANRQHLRQFLPQFPENNLAEQDTTITDLFNDKNFRFGNPLRQAQKLFRDGFFNPDVVRFRQLCTKAQRASRRQCLQRHHHRLLKQILVSRKELLDWAHSGMESPQRPRAVPVASCRQLLELKAGQRAKSIVREVKMECGDSNASSDEDSPPWLPSPLSSSSSVTLRVVSSLSTQDMRVTEKPELGEQELKAMLQKHKAKRKRHPDHPDLMTSDLQLGDLISRVNIGRKASAISLLDMALPKRKIREERRRKRLRGVRMDSEDASEPLLSSESPVPAAPLLTAPPLDTQVTPLAPTKEEVVEKCSSSPLVEEIGSCFFSLLENILRTEAFPTTAMVEEKVRLWQASPASALNPWFSAAPCWSELVLPALHFLSGEAKAGVMMLPSGFSPYVEFVDQTQQWRWIGPCDDVDKDLTSLCLSWVEAKDTVVDKVPSPPQMENDDASEVTSPPPRVWTDYIVRPSTGDERHVFQVQEQQRYDQPHKAFSYKMHGFQSVVGPVKGVFDKETSLNKAREHTLLRSDRPAYVTILSLVRDAAARLPNGEGTRAEICELLKDSQFLAPDVTSAQVNTVVSGALDRLHYEKDPCVKYDIGRKLWIYLHRSRSQEEFERIHQAQAAAAKARKALQQKPKPPSKPKSSGKDCGGKTPGSLDTGPEGGLNPMSPTSTTTTLTPLTVPPKSPLTSTASTPTKTAAPEPVRTSPSVLLVSPPSMPQLGTIPPTSSQPPLPQHTARIISQLGSGALSQVRVVSAQPTPGSSPGNHPPTLVQTSHQIRVPVSVGAKGLSQAVVSLPLRTQVTSSPAHVQSARGPSSLSVSAVTVTKPHTASPAHHVASPSALQGVSSANIKQVSIAGQLGVKTNLRIQGKDILRLPPSSITTDAKGQTVLRITPDMMATLTKSPVTTVKLSPDFLGSTGATAGTNKGISATLHVTPPQPAATATPNTAPSLASCPGDVQTSKTVAGGSALLKTTEETAIRLMPTLAVTIADQKARTFSTVSTADSKGGGTTIRIMPGLGVIPQKQGHTITMTTTAGSKPVSTGAHTVAMGTSGVGGSKGVTIGPPASGTQMTLGNATTRQGPVSATVVTTQTGQLPARITVPLSVLNQPLKNKSVVTSPLVKGGLNTNISSLGRNIILTTMPAGTKLIAGNKPVSFVTAQQLQQLQQQGQTTQVRIQTLPAQHLQQCVAGPSSKSVSTVVVKTAASPKRPPDLPPPTPPQP